MIALKLMVDTLSELNEPLVWSSSLQKFVPDDTTFTLGSKAKLKFLNTDKRSEERSEGVTSAAREKLIDSQTIFFAQKIPLFEDIFNSYNTYIILYIW